MSVPHLLTRRELADVLRISTRTLDRQRAAGLVLDPLPGSGHPTWEAVEVGDWLKAGRPPADVWRRLRARRR